MHFNYVCVFAVQFYQKVIPMHSNYGYALHSLHVEKYQCTLIMCICLLCILFYQRVISMHFNYVFAMKFYQGVVSMYFYVYIHLYVFVLPISDMLHQM